MAFGEGFPGKEKAKRFFLVAFTGGSPTSWFSEDEVLIERERAAGKSFKGEVW
jgi:hypothetical protein